MSLFLVDITVNTTLKVHVGLLYCKFYDVRGLSVRTLPPGLSFNDITVRWHLTAFFDEFVISQQTLLLCAPVGEKMKITVNPA